jgi:hypothetical protein
MSATTLTTEQPMRGATEVHARIICAAAAAGTLAPFALCSIGGTTGPDITAGLVDDRTTLLIGSIVAVYVATGLVLASVRLAGRVNGVARTVIGAAGVGVAVLYAAYYAVFGAAAVVATEVLDAPGGGLGEATSLMLNVVEITRYAPGLALVVAAVVAHRALSRPVWVTALVLVALAVFPLTTWVAALLIPLWLAVCAAAVR